MGREPEKYTGELTRRSFFDTSFSALLLARGLCVAVFLALCSMLLAPCFPAQAQQPKKVARIGYLSSLDAAGESGIRLALRELGYIEGQNIAIEYRYTEGKQERFPDLLRFL